MSCPNVQCRPLCAKHVRNTKVSESPHYVLGRVLGIAKDNLEGCPRLMLACDRSPLGSPAVARSPVPEGQLDIAVLLLLLLPLLQLI